MKRKLRMSLAIGMVVVLQLSTPAAVQNAFAMERSDGGASQSDSANESASDQTDREILVAHLIAEGAPSDEAKTIVDSLSDEDVEVLAANPAMLETAGADSGDIALTIILVLVALAIIGAAAA